MAPRGRSPAIGKFSRSSKMAVRFVMVSNKLNIPVTESKAEDITSSKLLTMSLMAEKNNILYSEIEVKLHYKIKSMCKYSVKIKLSANYLIMLITLVKITTLF